MHQRKALLRGGRSECPVCGEDHTSLPDLRRHMEECHGTRWAGGAATLGWIEQLTCTCRRGESVVCNLEGCGSVIHPSQFHRHILHNHYGGFNQLIC